MEDISELFLEIFPAGLERREFVVGQTVCTQVEIFPVVIPQPFKRPLSSSTEHNQRGQISMRGLVAELYE